MFPRLAADENFDARILAGLFEAEPGLSVVTVEQAGIRSADDPDVLEWAASEGRILLTHDASTMPNFVYERVAAGLPTPGVILVPDRMALGPAIEQTLMVLVAMSPEEIGSRVVVRLPL